MVDIALEPRSVMAANVAPSKNQKSHDLHSHLSKFDPFADNQENLLRTAFGYNTLGMPRLGRLDNLGNLDARILQQFIMDNITPASALSLPTVSRTTVSPSNSSVRDSVTTPLYP